MDDRVHKRAVAAIIWDRMPYISGWLVGASHEADPFAACSTVPSAALPGWRWLRRENFFFLRICQWATFAALYCDYYPCQLQI